MVWLFHPSSFHSTVDYKRAERDRALQAVSVQELSPEETRIVGSTAQAIVESIQNGQWTAAQVVRAFTKSAIRAHVLTNCITEVMFEDALREAEILDREFAQTKQIKGPLHGLPVSLKDLFDVAGYDTSIGFTQWTRKPATSDADLVKIIREAGGIPLFKTNVPQTMFAFECANPLWGRTTNPFSPNHTCGGSSGGEAAALAMDGSSLGFGSDVGGSLRIPAHYCGIYSLKPGHGRISPGGGRGTSPGFEGLSSVAGPMGRSVGDVELACRAIFGKEGRGYYPAPLPYRDIKLPEKLKFGYYTFDGFVKASPACIRAVTETVDALRKEGHECIEFEIPSPGRALEIFAELTSADGYKTMLSHLGPDPRDAAIFVATLGPRLPGWLRRLASWLVSTVVGDVMFSRALTASRVKSVGEYHEAVRGRNAYNEEFYEKIWKHYGFDAIIAPVQASPAMAHGGCKNLSAIANATLIYNVVDSPTGCIPVTRVDPVVDGLTEEWTTRAEGKGQGSIILEGRLYGESSESYDANAMKGLPVGIQIVGKRWEEEKVIELMKLVDGVLGTSRGFGPGSWKKWNDRV